MARADPALTSFNGGELSAYVGGRPDTKIYAKGCRKLRNMIPRVTGVASYRPGTVYGSACKNATAGQLIPFEANTGARTVIELGSTYMRFFDGATRQPIIDTAGVWTPTVNGLGTRAELTTALLLTNQVRYAQSNDVMWLVDGASYPQKLQRIAAYKFSVGKMGDGVNSPGPFADPVPTNTITFSASAATGTVTITASTAYFAAKNVGEYFQLFAPQNDTRNPWETGKTVSVGNTRTSLGRNYRALTAGTTGTVRPNHSFGAQYDGVTGTGVQWLYTDDNFGEFVITAFTNSTTVTASVGKALPASVVGAGSAVWGRQAWNVDDGYPSGVCFFRQRLCFGRGSQLWCSQVGDFENFTLTEGGVATPETAISIQVALQQNNRILWLAAAPNATALIAGTASGPISIAEQTTSEPFGPANITVTLIDASGCAPVSPAVIGTSLVYIQRGGRKVRQLVYDFNSNGFVAPDLTAYADHLAPKESETPGGLQQLGYLTTLVRARAPDPIIWTCGSVGDNIFYGLTFDQEQEVSAWSSHQLGGIGFDPNVGAPPAGFPTFYVPPYVYSMCVVTAPDGINDDVWMLTGRFGKANVQDAQKYLEILGPGGAVNGSLTDCYAYDRIPDVSQASHLDFHRAHQTGTVNIPGMSHIPDGTIASALVSGYVVPDAAITATAFPIRNGPISRFGRVGFKYRGILHPFPPRGESETGAPEGKRTRNISTTIRLVNSVGGLYGETENPNECDPIIMRKGGDAMDTATPLQSGDYTVLSPGGWHGGRDDQDQCEMVFIQDQPLPAHVAGMYPKLVVA